MRLIIAPLAPTELSYLIESRIRASTEVRTIKTPQLEVTPRRREPDTLPALDPSKLGPIVGRSRH